jgi:hypothetical protein
MACRRRVILPQCTARRAGEHDRNAYSAARRLSLDPKTATLPCAQPLPIARTLLPSDEPKLATIAVMHHRQIISFVLASTLCACADERPPVAEGASDDGSDDAGESGSGEDGDSSDIKLDLIGGSDAAGENLGDCGSNNSGSGEAFSIIWIANSTEGTVSKVDTVEAVELARYRTGPDSDADPSRTSVNLFGDVAIGNRSGSVVKIAARIENCIDVDQDGEITTSLGPDDVLEWGADECVLWQHDVGFDTTIAGHDGGPRAIAWDAGTPGPDGCPQDPKVWVGWRDQPNTSVIVRRLDGHTGASEGEVTIDDWYQYWGHGTYGGATDKNRDFWGLGTSGTLIRVDADTLEVQRWNNPEQDRIVYGIALDAEGDPWLAGWDGSLWRFDVASETWEDRGQVGASTRLRGLAIDPNGHAWIAGNDECGLIRYDTLIGETVAEHIELPECEEPVGVSIDAAGSVWVVDRGASRAYRVDPDTQSVDATVTGLVDPYTYSDMTGAGLDVVVNPPVG